MPLDAYTLREDFPELRRNINGWPLAYLDNAATSLKPEKIINVICEFYKDKYANIGRGIHTLSREATEAYEEARRKVARFIGADEREIIFVRNTTEAINLVSLAWVRNNLKRGDIIVTTYMEHHSNLLPWLLLSKEKELELRIININKQGVLDLDTFKEVVEGARFIAIAHKSNVTGVVNDVKEVCKLAKNEGARVLIDGAQSVPHMCVNVKEIGCDFLAFSGHKMLGPSGIGVLYVKKEVYGEMMPVIVGGGIVRNVKCDKECKVEFIDPPHMFEAGTPNVVGAVGLSAAVDYLNEIGMDDVEKHETYLTEILLGELLELEGVKVLGPLQAKERPGIVSFTLKGHDPHELAMLLDLKGIAVRSGFHCAQPLHEILGVYEGSVRASFYLYNTQEEVMRLVNTLREIIKAK